MIRKQSNFKKRICEDLSHKIILLKTGRKETDKITKAHFMCNGFFLSDSNIELADRKYPLNQIFFTLHQNIMKRKGF